jgi:hypothetical protein
MPTPTAAWQFMTAPDAATVTSILTSHHAKKANVAFAGKATGNKYQVWFLPSSATHHWHTKPVAPAKILVTDTATVTSILGTSGLVESSVTFAGSEDTYHVWWRL